MILSYLMASNLCSFSLTGFFILKSHERCRTTTVRRDGSTGAAFHLFYDTDLLCGKLKSMPATVCIYSPPGDAPLTNDTVAYINTKCHVPASINVGPILLDASELTALAGDPSHADYEKGLPDFKSPSVVGLGFVDGPVQGPPNGIVTFHVRVSEFVHGRRLESVIMCVATHSLYIFVSHFLFSAAAKIKVPVSGKTFHSPPLGVRSKFKATSLTPSPWAR
jgi:hypothetical protein